MGAIKSKLRRTRSVSRKEKEGKEKGFKEERRGSKKDKRRLTKLPESPSARRTVDPRLPFSNYRQVFSIRNAWKAVSRGLEDCAKENLIRFFKENPGYLVRFGDIKHLKDDEEMRANDDFEIIAVDMYQLFDDVIGNLELVNKALTDIQMASRSTLFTRRMLKDFESSFIETIRMHLGVERFPETTENNMRTLYAFVRDELSSYMDEVEVYIDPLCPVETSEATKVETNDAGDNEHIHPAETDECINNGDPAAEESNKDADRGEGLEGEKDTSEQDNSAVDNNNESGDTEKRNSNPGSEDADKVAETNTENTETNHIEITKC